MDYITPQADAQVAPVASLLADASRSTILWMLSDGRALPACELALAAGVKAPTISHHLRKLLDGGLVTSEKHGRHRYYRLADPTVVRLLEGMAAFAPALPPRTFREGQRGKALRFARTCYDHLAGRLGVAITESLVDRGALSQTQSDFEISDDGCELFESIGVDVSAARRARRSFARCCLDWSERRHHLAGALGAAFLDRLFELEWIRRAEIGRAVHVTRTGREQFRQALGIEV